MKSDENAAQHPAPAVDKVGILRGVKTGRIDKKLKKTTSSVSKNAEAVFTEDGPEQTIPGLDRLAGHVKRTTHRIVRAEPPPSNPSQSSSIPKRDGPSRRKKASKKNDGDGGGGDSSDDSSNGDRQNDRDNVNPSRARRQRNESELPEHIYALAEAEEQERMRLRRALREVVTRWDEIKPFYQHDQREVDRKMNMMKSLSPEAFLSYEEVNPPSFSKKECDTFRQKDAQFREYVDEALYGDIEKNLSRFTEDPDEMEDDLDEDEMIDRVEVALLSKLRSFSDKAGKYRPPLTEVVLAMHNSLWRHIRLQNSMEVNTEVMKKADIEVLARAHFETFYHTSMCSISIQDIVDAYLAKLITSLSHAVAHDLKNGGVYPHTRGSSAIKAIRKSRLDGHLTAEYKEWVFSAMNPKWHRAKRDKTIRKFKRSMKSRGMDFRQVLLPSEVQIDALSLVLIKNDVPTSVQNVPPWDLRRIGYLKDTRIGDRPLYYRHKVDEHIIFRISIEGKILGMISPNGRFLDWQAVETLSQILVSNMGTQM